MFTDPGMRGRRRPGRAGLACRLGVAGVGSAPRSLFQESPRGPLRRPEILPQAMQSFRPFPLGPEKSAGRQVLTGKWEVAPGNYPDLLVMLSLPVTCRKICLEQMPGYFYSSALQPWLSRPSGPGKEFSQPLSLCLDLGSLGEVGETLGSSSYSFIFSKKSVHWFHCSPGAGLLIVTLRWGGCF